MEKTKWAITGVLDVDITHLYSFNVLSLLWLASSIFNTGCHAPIQLFIWDNVCLWSSIPHSFSCVCVVRVSRSI
jgi:hypothetical protein